MTRVFLDANIFIYAIGRPHRLKRPSGRVISLAGMYPEAFITSAEVFQEILHRAVSLRIWSHVRPGFFEFLQLMEGRIAELQSRDVEHAGHLADSHSGLSSRDLVHLAVMQRLGCSHIITADKAFDAVNEVQRLDPTDLEEWRSLLEPR